MPNNTLQILKKKQEKAAETKLGTALTMLEKYSAGLKKDSPAQQTAHELVANFSAQKDRFSTKNTMTARQFKENCNALLNTANHTLKDQKGWPGIFSFVNFVVDNIASTQHIHFFKSALTNSQQTFESNAEGLEDAIKSEQGNSSRGPS